MSIDQKYVGGQKARQSVGLMLCQLSKKKAFVSFKDAHLLRKRLLNYSAQLPKGFMVNMISNKRSN